MTSLLSTFSTHSRRSEARTGERTRLRAPAFGRRSTPSLGKVIMAALSSAYRAAQEAQMRRIRMQIALHGVRYDRDNLDNVADQRALASRRLDLCE